MMFAGAPFASVPFGSVYREQGLAVDAIDLRPILTELNGIDVRQFVAVDSFSKSDTLGQPVTGAIIFLNPDITPRTGDRIRILFHRSIEFSGTIDRVRVSTDDLRVLRYECDLVDGSQILTRRQVRRNFTNMTVQAIIDSLLDNELAGELVTMGTIDSRLVIPLVDASLHARAFDLLREVASATGQTFWVDFAFRIQMRGSPGAGDRGSAGLSTLTPDFILDESGNPIPDESGNPILEEEQPYDRLQILGEPNVLVRGTSRTQDRERYRNVQMVVVTGTPQVENEEALVITVVRQNDDEIASRAEIEGGTGRYEEVDEITHPTSNLFEDLTLIGNGFGDLKLITNGALRIVITLQVRGYGFRAGQVGTVELPTFGISGDFILQRVSVKEVAGQHLFHTLELVQSSAQQRAYESWLAILGKGKISIQLFAFGALVHGSATFTTPGAHNWVVPAGVTVVTVTTKAPGGGGGGGGKGGLSPGGRGGSGGKAVSSVNVLEGQELNVLVGSKGLAGANHVQFPTSGTPGGGSSVTRLGVSLAQADSGGGGIGGGADGAPGGGSGSIVTVGGGKAGGAGGNIYSNLNPTDGSDGEVSITF